MASKKFRLIPGSVKSLILSHLSVYHRDHDHSDCRSSLLNDFKRWQPLELLPLFVVAVDKSPGFTPAGKSKFKSGCHTLCRGLPLDERQSAAELEAVLQHHHNLQEKLAEDMLSLARNLKNNTLAAQNIIKQDNQVTG